jgi:light-regulated signal transduction histidine kinase (bacteriophytochrome)
MEEMHAPMNIEDVGIEVAYIRAVLERHGGSLFVATAGETSAGFGFTLPLGGP